MPAIESSGPIAVRRGEVVVIDLSRRQNLPSSFGSADRHIREYLVVGVGHRELVRADLRYPGIGAIWLRIW